MTFVHKAFDILPRSKLGVEKDWRTLELTQLNLTVESIKINTRVKDFRRYHIQRTHARKSRVQKGVASGKTSEQMSPKCLIEINLFSMSS